MLACMCLLPWRSPRLALLGHCHVRPCPSPHTAHTHPTHHPHTAHTCARVHIFVHTQFYHEANFKRDENYEDYDNLAFQVSHREGPLWCAAHRGGMC